MRKGCLHDRAGLGWQMLMSDWKLASDFESTADVTKGYHMTARQDVVVAVVVLGRDMTGPLGNLLNEESVIAIEESREQVEFENDKTSRLLSRRVC